MKHTMQRRQQGMTFIGLLCILAMAGVIVYAGVRLVPVYLNYMNIVRTMETTASEFKGENPDPGAMRNSLERHWEITTISAVDYKDIEITKDEDGGVSHARRLRRFGALSRQRLAGGALRQDREGAVNSTAQIGRALGLGRAIVRLCFPAAGAVPRRGDSPQRRRRSQ